MQVAIDRGIDALIRELEELKLKHQEHVRQHLLKHFKSDGLRAKLLNGERLTAQESTGNAFWVMLQELGKTSKVESPYVANKEQVEKIFASAKESLGKLSYGIRGIWEKHKYTFSSTWKHENIGLS